MNTPMKVMLVCAIVNVVVVAAVWRVVPVHAQSQLPSVTVSHPDQSSRFRILAEEGVVQPDGRTYVTGTKIWTVADKTSGQCYLLFITVNGTAVSGPITCP